MPAGWAAAAQVAGNMIQADAQRSASNKAADKAARANDKVLELQRYMYDQTRTDNMPALGARNSALAQLQQLLGIGGDPKAAGYGSLNQQFTGANLQNDPGYQFGLKQGTTALERSAAARGGLYSGATMKALDRYGQDYGGTKFNEAFQRNRQTRGDMFDRFASLAGLGQTGASQIAGAGQNYANQASDSITGLGNVLAANQINRGNQLSNGVNQLAAWAMNRGGDMNWGGNMGGSHNQPAWWGGYTNPVGDTYGYQGATMPDSLRGGG